MRKTSSKAQLRGSSVFTKVALSCSSCWFGTFGWFGLVWSVWSVELASSIWLLWLVLEKKTISSQCLSGWLLFIPSAIQDGYSRLKRIKNCVCYCIYRDYQNIAKGTTDPRVEFSFTKVNCWGHITSSNKDLDQISSSEHWPSINFCFKSCLNLNFKILTKPFAQNSTKVYLYDQTSASKSATRVR